MDIMNFRSATRFDLVRPTGKLKLKPNQNLFKLIWFDSILISVYIYKQLKAYYIILVVGSIKREE